MKELFFIFMSLTFMSLTACDDTPEPKDVNAVITSVGGGALVDVEFSNVPRECNAQERVHLIGVSIPDDYAKQARDYTYRYVGRQVKVVFDYVCALRDTQGRLLAYIYIDSGGGKQLNVMLIRDGYGIYDDSIPFTSSTMNYFETAQEYAKKNKLGMWRTEDD